MSLRESNLATKFEQKRSQRQLSVVSHSVRRMEHGVSEAAKGSGRKAKEPEFRSQNPGEQNIWHGEERDQKSEVRRHRGQRIDLNGFNDFNGLNEFAEGERLNGLNDANDGLRTTDN